ncbi:MAG TPA: outer membrane lipoprotein-sorting protein [Candidatus Acidoferrum sp.]|nr:outer membrane lipoprotein-sorting protein [Candidatus Acidoferrum sp.]
MTRKIWAGLVALCAIAAFTCMHALPTSGQSRSAWNVEGVLKQLDAAAKDFHSLSADIERTKVTVVVNDHSTETGTILVHGEKMLLDLKVPDPRTILRTGDNLYIYNPGLKRVEEYNLGKNRALVDQFLLLGFGTEGKELQKGYLVAVLKEEKLDDRKTVELELTPKSQAVRDQIAKIQIWLDESSWLPVQQQFYEAGSGDYSIVRYSKVVRNPPIAESEFKPHWPKGTVRVKPQG